LLQYLSGYSPQTFLADLSLSLTCFVLGSQLALREVDVERDEECSAHVVVLVVGHALVLLGDAGAGPRHLAAFHHHLDTPDSAVIKQELIQCFDAVGWVAGRASGL